MVHHEGLPRHRPSTDLWFLGCRSTGESVPLLAEALVRTGRTGLTADVRAKLLSTGCGDMETVPDCLRKLLSGHPSLDTYLRRWERAEAHRQAQAKKRAQRKKASLDDSGAEDDSGSNHEEVPEVMTHLSAVALDLSLIHI